MTFEGLYYSGPTMYLPYICFVPCMILMMYISHVLPSTLVCVLLFNAKNVFTNQQLINPHKLILHILNLEIIWKTMDSVIEIVMHSIYIYRPLNIYTYPKNKQKYPFLFPSI